MYMCVGVCVCDVYICMCVYVRTHTHAHFVTLKCALVHSIAVSTTNSVSSVDFATCSWIKVME